ncbi:MAG TPA: MetS family NSS transporter small subunit [Nocardioidaceae bacterium]|nr:MetS family NSS transporter small subunit [Nocardioidaceae bacterium]
MDTGPLIMFLVGAIGLWGGLILAIINYNRVSRRQKAE